MAVNDNMRGDNLERDPQLARLYREADGEEPPVALDAAIRAAARREVNARPGELGGGATPTVRQKRSWYVPVSIAAVLVLSVSLVTLMKEQKGDELAEAPRKAVVPATPAPRADATAMSAPAPASPNAMPNDDARSKTQVPGEAKSNAGTQPKVAKKETAEQSLQKQRAPAPVAGEDQPAVAQAERDQQTAPEPFPMAREREAPAVSRADTEDAAARREMTRGATQEASKSTAPSGVSAGALMAPKLRAKPTPAEPQRAPETGGRFAQRRPSTSTGIRGFDSGAPPSESESRAENRSPADAAAGYAAPAAKVPLPAAPPAVAPVVPPPSPSMRMAEKPRPPPAPLWRELENQPPEKWLERIAELRRQDRATDADELLAEFRRRFPDHPAALR